MWTFAMEVWMYGTRIPAVLKYKPSISPSSTKEEFNGKLPPQVRWKADNYNHLHEQPTQFYAIALTLALLGADDKVNVGLAWGYVGLRVVHSLVQAVNNKVMLRFKIFVGSSVVLLGMAGRAAVLMF
jgi:hypothetical protein